MKRSAPTTASKEQVAVATARLRMAPATLKRVRGGLVEKGDLFAAAQLSALMAARRTRDLLPQADALAVKAVLTQLQIRPLAVEVRVEVHAATRPAEMAALTACCAAALSVYDMLRAHDRGMVLERVALEESRGARGPGKRRAPPRRP